MWSTYFITTMIMLFFVGLVVGMLESGTLLPSCRWVASASLMINLLHFFITYLFPSGIHSSAYLATSLVNLCKILSIQLHFFTFEYLWLCVSAWFRPTSWQVKSVLVTFQHRGVSSCWTRPEFFSHKSS